MQLLMLSLLLLLTIGWLVLRIRRNRIELAQEQAPRAPSETGAFHAVSLLYSKDSCGVAKEMTGRRFLSSAAPRLPLPGCDQMECRCKFTHHKDRRKHEDRRSPFSPTGHGGGTGSFRRERREQGERRKNDAP